MLNLFAFEPQSYTNVLRQASVSLFLHLHKACGAKDLLIIRFYTIFAPKIFKRTRVWTD